MSDIIKKYFEENYSDKIIITDCEKGNYTFDLLISDRSINVSIECKSRKFSTKEYREKNNISEYEMSDVRWLEEYDILIELYQGLKYLTKTNICELNNKNINNIFSCYDLDIANGWFYKCLADRLVYFRFLDEKFYDVIDLDFKLFKQWFHNNTEMFKLHWSGKSTKTINAKVFYKDIPKIIFKYTKNY